MWIPRWFLYALLVGCAATSAPAQPKFDILYTFGSAGANDGDEPGSKLVMDAAGNLYGTTRGGGTIGAGTVFELSPNGDGTWTETMLYSFCIQFQCGDGQQPEAGLIFDQQGNLYGTTMLGGSGDNVCCNGVVFELSPPEEVGDAWTEKILWTFQGSPDGRYPLGKLIFDHDGNLYGTTSSAGAGSRPAGTVFELSPLNDGRWEETILFSFDCIHQFGGCLDGNSPRAGVTFDKSGNLYGTTEVGGGNQSEGAGVVYKLSPGENGWTQSVVYNFTASRSQHGRQPLGAINIDSEGNLYSTVSWSQPSIYGGVFRLTAANGGHEAFLPFTFEQGAHPAAGVLIDPRNNNLYGTAPDGGAGFGTVYRVSGKKVTVLHSFTGGGDGSDPTAALIADKKGNLYGVARQGGTFGHGVVFQITR